MEVGLRRLAAYIHAHRTGDAAAATRMLAARPAGAHVDIATDWLVEASAYSRAEHKRTERVHKLRGASKGSGKGKEKGKEKGGRGGADGPAPARS